MAKVKSKTLSDKSAAAGKKTKVKSKIKKSVTEQLNDKKKIKNKSNEKKIAKSESGVKVNLKMTAQSVTSLKTEPDKERKIKRYKSNKKVKYSTSELKHFRNIILHERKAILESAKANMDALVDKDSGEYKGDNLTYSSHMAEQGTDEMEREKNYLFVQRDEKYLGYLQDALMRIDQGTYGICVDCRDKPKNMCRTCPLVVKERLELVPITQHCIECKNLRGR